ncbi:MAG TPA: D-alanyl-D-alanine carboxypeptidase/D-alanyl-D-alanine-endopeptidase [Pyrinomonadaceae bacterium]|nr:D-alanyl-D-alanine carboxypeptidase/D-alanyl-D-alanine-endopeptidase [Pyrinomonadaceae bacterium]
MNDNQRMSSLVKGVLILLLAVSGLLFVKPLITGNAKDNPSTEVRKAPNPGQMQSSTSGTEELARRINAAIDESEFASARWGIKVVTLSDGKTLYERDADKLFIPASNMKIYTTGVALALLGADYRWRTSVYGAAQPDGNGTLRGDITLYGRGAPDLVTRSQDASRASLTKLANDLYGRGIRRIDGNVVGDESFFRGDSLGDGWQWTDMQWYFGAEASALSVNENQIDVNLVPADKAEQPPIARTSDVEDYVTVDNRMVTGKPGARTTVGIHRGLSDNNIQVWGEFAPSSKGFGARLSVHNPALWTAKLFVNELKQRGISVAGQAQSRDSRHPQTQRFDPAKAIELAAAASDPLSEIVRKTNKESNNLYAELILRTLGREREQMLGLPQQIGRERGDDELGLAVVRLWLGNNGIPTARLALHDGSGLSRLNLVTPASTVGLLLSLSKTPSGSTFRQSLPISGRDGTLGGRLKTLVDSVSAKTGSLTYTHSLSGYLTTAAGEQVVFSILCNDQTGRGNAIRLIDEITSLTAASPSFPAK